jgi:hypothetical protein
MGKLVLEKIVFILMLKWEVVDKEVFIDEQFLFFVTFLTNYRN